MQCAVPLPRAADGGVSAMDTPAIIRPKLNLMSQCNVNQRPRRIVPSSCAEQNDNKSVRGFWVRVATFHIERIHTLPVGTKLFLTQHSGTWQR